MAAALVFKIFAGLLYRDVVNINFFGFGASTASKETAAIAMESQNKSTKLEILAYYSTAIFKLEFYHKVKNKVSIEDQDIDDYLETMAEEIVTIYDKEFKVNLNYDVIYIDSTQESSYPNIVKRFLPEKFPSGFSSLPNKKSLHRHNGSERNFYYLRNMRLSTSSLISATKAFRSFVSESFSP
jgi:hypothetical protein